MPCDGSVRGVHDQERNDSILYLILWQRRIKTYPILGKIEGPWNYS